MTKLNLEATARAGSVAHMIRGGRLVKRKGQVLSFAPHVGQLCSVSCGALAAGLALGVSLLGAAPASAGTCDPLLPPQDPNGSIVTCSAQADPVNDVTVVIKGEQLTINTTPGFGVSTSAGDGLNIESSTGTEFGLIFSDNEASQITAAAGTALAINAVGNTTVTTNGALVGGTYGIKATFTSVGALTLDATGSVEGETLDGINADLIGEARDITVRAATVTGGQNGIDVNNDASGNTFVGSSISVTAINGVGMIVNNQSSSTENLTIDVVNVIGKTGGISAYNNGTGTTIVSATGLVGGTAVDGYTTADGIRVINTAIGNTAIPAGQTAAPAIGMQVSAHDVNGGVNGIFADHNGVGGLVITADGTVNGRSAAGINANNSTEGTYLSITTATVTGGNNGVFAVNNGDGATSITANGNITGTAYNGIYVTNGSTATDVTIDTKGNTILGGDDGIQVINNGIGATLITSTGDITGTAGDGIDVSTDASAQNIAINANNVTGGDDGIDVQNNGNGFASVTANGLVKGGAGGNGIEVNNAATATALTISAAAVEGGVNGIFAENLGTGATSVSASGAVSGGTADGIYVTAAGINLTVNTTANVTGGDDGIDAKNDGGGFTLITAIGDVEGKGTRDAIGISAVNAGAASSLEIRANNANTVQSGGVGISAQNLGSGATSVSSTGNVIGVLFDGITALNSGTTLTINANIVTGGADGIDAQNDGNDFTIITATGLVKGGVGGNGIEVNNAATATALTVDAAAVTGGVNGIFAENLGTGATLVSASGDVKGATGFGIYAQNGDSAQNIAGGPDLTIEANYVSGLTGIYARNNGTGFTSITTNGIVKGTGTYSDGINAFSGTGTDYLKIVTIDVESIGNGIRAQNNGDGSTIITTNGDVEGTNGIGISVVNTSTTSSLTINAVNVKGGAAGIAATNVGTGATLISSTGDVQGGTLEGVFALSAGEGLTIDVNTVSGGRYGGIAAQNNGTGATLITASGLVKGSDQNGILAVNFDGASDLTVAGNAVQGGGNGIFATNFGTGATLVSASGAVDGTTGFGIYAQNGYFAQNIAGGTDLTIDVESDVKGGTSGIFAVNNGTGVTLINTTGPNLLGGGTVTGYAGNGIDVLNEVGASDLIIEAASVTGSLNGIKAVNKSDGSFTSITATGDVLGEAEDGIYARNDVGTTDLTIVANNVEGGANGVFANNEGSGATSITTTGDVASGDALGDGIFVSAYGTDLTVKATGSVIANDTGIRTYNYGSGSTSITAEGKVTAYDGDGIYAFNEVGTTNLTIVANNVEGGVNGIFAKNEGNGATSITTSGEVSTDELNTGPVFGDGIYVRTLGIGSTSITANALVSGGDDGIDVRNADLSGDISVIATDVTAISRGIEVFNDGIGAASILASGNVSGSAGDGVNLQSDGTNVTVDVNNVSGGLNGIYVSNSGTGATLITASGLIAGDGGDGIYAYNIAGATDLTILVKDVTGSDNGIATTNFGANLTIDANNVSGQFYGVVTYNSGTGATLITSSGFVTGNGADGIYALNAASATNLVIDIVDATGGVGNGINAENNGAGGYTSITSTGTVTGALDGIYALNEVGTSNLTIVANNVEGAGDDGIDVVNKGTGFTSVTAYGEVIGAYDNGIVVVNAATATDLTVKANIVTGDYNGIDAYNGGTGSTTITTTGDITGETGKGIFASNGVRSANLTVIAVKVTGADDGIEASNNGTGTTSITATGAVTGGENGILANSGAETTGLTINAVDLTGGNGSFDDGIEAFNEGKGATSITATGAVTGGAKGIYAFNNTTAINLTVAANDVTGGEIGISAQNLGTGATLISATGAVKGTSGAGMLISSLNAGAGTVSVAANSASGLLGGIVVQNDGAGASTVSVSGTIAGGDGVGIETSTLAGNLTTINIADTAIVGATSGNAIANNEGNSVLNIAANAVVNGSVELDNGNDTANFARNGALASITRLDGGDNISSADGFVDTLNFNGRDIANLVGATIVNWEIININGGTVGFSDAAIVAETINVNNGGTLDGTNNLVATANVNIAGGGAFTIGNAEGTGVTRITGNLANAGIVSLRGRSAIAGAGDTLNVGGNYAGAGGQIVLDTVLNGDNSLTDLLNVTGNVTGGSVIAINNAGGVGGFTTGDGIRIVRVGGTSAQDGFRLLDDVQAGAFRYDLFLGGVTDPGDQDWYLRTVGLSDVAATTLSFARLSDDIAITFLGTLHERVGEQEHLAKRGYQSGGVSGIWGRFIGKGFREKLTSPTLGDVKSTGSITGLQMGLDFVRNVKGDGSATFVGAYSGYADGSSTDKNIFQGVSRKSGTSDSKGWLAGLYGTHYASAGWYANVVLQANWVDASANGRNGAVLKTDGRTYLSSLELGQSLKLADRLAFEPQVQLIYGDTQFDAATDSDGIESRVGIESSLLGRAGFRLKTTKSEKYNAEGGLFSGYLKANLWHNLSGADIELFSADQAIGGFEPKKTWVDVGLGTTLTVAKNTEIYFDADVEFGLDKKNTSGRGNVGLRFNW